MTDKFISILASGTGGHVYPAHTVATEFVKRGYKILWIGTKKGIENKIIKHESIILKHISSTGIRGKPILQKIVGILSLFKSIFEVFLLMREYRPKLTIGFGGYVSVPGSIISYFFRIPVVIHEQNSIAGTANKINYFFAKKTFETFPNSFSKFSEKIVHSGNPIREVFLNLEKPEEKYKSHNSYLNILALGGSQGSAFFNECLPFAFSHFHNKNISITHLSGVSNAKLVEDRYKKYKINATVSEFTEDIDVLYDWANLIICRSGATTLSEISKIGRAIILVPFPHATDNHQFYNASYLANQSACILIEQSDAFVESFVNTINIVLNDQKRMYTLSKNIQKVFPKDTISIIVDQSIELIKN